MEPRVPVTIEARLGYRNEGDPVDEWKEYATSTEIRTMDCSPPNVIFQDVIWCHLRSQHYFPPIERWISVQLFALTTV